MHENRIRLASNHGREQGGGKNLAIRTTPVSVTAATYICAAGGRAVQPVSSRSACTRRQGRTTSAIIGFSSVNESQLRICGPSLQITASCCSSQLGSKSSS